MKKNFSGKYVCYLISLYCISTAAQAQITIQRGKVVSEPNSFIAMNAPLVNFGNLVHQGTLFIESDLLNYGSYDAANGSIVLLGASQYILTDRLTLSQLRIKGGDIKTLEGRLTIANSLQLEQGLLRVLDPAQLVLGESATILQSNPSSYIWGDLCHWGTGKKFFPIGGQHAYAPLTLIHVQGTNPLVKASYNPVDGQPYWVQTQLAGNYEGSPVTITFASDNPDYEAYAQSLSIVAGSTPRQTDNILESSLDRQDQYQYTLTSFQPTSLPWISVGFFTEESQEEIYVPNAFSPEATNPEDRVIKVYGRYLSHNNFHFGIQDTWGRWLYQTTSLEEAMNTGWTTAGFSTSPAQFRYVVSGRFLSGTSFQHSDVIVKF